MLRPDPRPERPHDLPTARGAERPGGLDRGSRLRAWEEPTAWAAVALLDGVRAPWLGQAQRSRLLSALVGIPGAEVAARTRNRATVHRYHAHPRALGHLARDVVASGATQGIGGLIAIPGSARRVRRPFRRPPAGGALPAGSRSCWQRHPARDGHAEGRRRGAGAGTPARPGRAGHRRIDRRSGALGRPPPPRTGAGAAPWLTCSDPRRLPAAGVARGRTSPSWPQPSHLQCGR